MTTNRILRRHFLKLSGTSCVTALLLPGYGLPFHAPEKDKNIGETQKAYPFIFGAQYYRAPTPEPDLWENDLKRMHDLGFTDVKFWVQWRWSHLSGDRFVFDDLDTLMDMALNNNLRVTLNIIFDVSPIWLFQKYPDAKQVENNGHIIEPYAVGHRQIGGHPGPCYHHSGALMERKKFMKAAVEHFKAHLALSMWDVWNEPELSFPQRSPSIDKLACYCENCQTAFIEWVKRKYNSVDELNKIWGRNYEDWNQLEVPRSTETFNDFIDWREFHIETMTNEARWRLEMAKTIDPKRIHYLHVVPNTLLPFNPVSTCADDFEMAKYCDVFAATMNSGPLFTPQVLSAGWGKICYNVESHINGGNTNFHQAIVELPDLLNEFLPQIGMGIKGFLFWQYRPEVLGFESPAWGLTNLDGSDRPVTQAAKALWGKISPFKDQLMQSMPLPAEIGIWKSRKNEIFHFCTYGDFNSLATSINAYSEEAYWNSYNYRYINSSMLESGDLDGIKLLIMPSCYYITESEAEAINHWVENGGTLLAEGTLAGYNGTTGRHSRTVPGCGLSEKWDIEEFDSVSSFRLKLTSARFLEMNVSEDTKKMLKVFGTTGSKYFPIRLKSGNIVWGAKNCAKIRASDARSLGWFYDDFPCIVQKESGRGRIIYCGTNIGEGREKDGKGFSEIFNHAVSIAGVNSNLNVQCPESKLRVDTLYKDGNIEFIVIWNNSGEKKKINLMIDEKYNGLFSDTKLFNSTKYDVLQGFCDIFYRL